MTAPQLVASLSCIITIATGRRHSTALDVCRKVYGWGRQESGAIGIRINESHNPSEIVIAHDDNSVIKQLSCGSDHSCFLTEHGDVFACGENQKGQLGLGYNSPKEYRPLRVRIKDLREDEYIA